MSLKGLGQNHTLMIMEVKNFIRDRNYLYYLLLQRYVTQKVARSWRIGAQHTLSPPGPHTYTVHRVYLDNVHNVLICFVFGVIILQTRRIRNDRQSNLGVTAPAVTGLRTGSAQRSIAHKNFFRDIVSSFGWRNLIPPRPHREHSCFEIHI